MKRITVLMVLSMLLLATFLGYWLNTQYQSDKAVLRKDLENIFARSVSDVTDSMLLGKIIMPLLKEEKHLRFKVYPDTLTNNEVRIITSEREDVRTITDSLQKAHKTGRTQIKILRKNGDLPMESITQITDTSFPGTDLMERGIRILINKLSNDSNARIPLQAPALLADFKHKLRKEELYFSANWMEQGEETDGIIITETFPGRKLSVLVQHYNGYLVKSLLPETFFALLLLSITGTAFLSMYLGFRSQQKLSQMKDDLVSNMTHELKTPIATVKVALEALNNYQMINDRERTKEYLTMAVSEIDRLDLLVNQALNTSLLEKGTMNIQRGQQDVVVIVRETMNPMQIRLEEEGGKLSIVTNGTDFNASVDKLHLQGVLINLLDNSIKHADKTPVITINVEAKRDQILILVTDNGPGIPAKYIDKVFDKFFRVPAGAIHNTKGYGLGLSYARQVVEQHGGTISVSNNTTEGCTFTISLPRTLS
jgi:signal transduction histidine kinase